MSGLRTLGRRAIVGADEFTPQQRAGSPEMTPVQLADLDRKLSQAEQSRVDRFQVGEADALQKKEEAMPYVDPQTGEKRVAVVTYVPGEDAPASAPTWKKVLFAVLAAAGALGLGFSLTRRK